MGVIGTFYDMTLSLKSNLAGCKNNTDDTSKNEYLFSFYCFSQTIARNPNVAMTYVDDPGHVNPGLKKTIQDYNGTLQISVDHDQQHGGPSNYGDAPLRPSTGDVIYTQPGIYFSTCILKVLSNYLLCIILKL